MVKKLQECKHEIDMAQGDIDQTYVSKNCKFSWLGNMRGGRRLQISEWIRCRELFILQTKKHMHLKKDRSIIGYNTDQMSFMLGYRISDNITKTAKAIHARKSDKGILSALNALHIIEKEVGWELTIITKIKDKAVYVVTGDSNWNYMPQLASIYLLILRTGKAVDFSRVKTVGGIMRKCAEHIRALENDPATQYNLDMSQIRITYKYWMLLISNKDKIVGKRRMATMYKRNKPTNGMASLVTGTADSVTFKNWVKVMNSNG